MEIKFGLISCDSHAQEHPENLDLSHVQVQMG